MSDPASDTERGDVAGGAAEHTPAGDVAGSAAEHTPAGSAAERTPKGEYVYVVDRVVLFDGFEPWLGVRRERARELLARIDAEGTFVPRGPAESDATVKQIIPYLVLRDGDRIFLMRRTRGGADARLHDLYSIGVGGHLNPGDETPLGGLAREWREEIEADFVPDFEFLGLLNDDTVDVGRHHLGLVYLADAAGRPLAVRETEKLSGSFEPIAAARAVYEGMETWSQLVLDALDGAGRLADRRILR